jgi:hypothetical protein
MWLHGTQHTPFAVLFRAFGLEEDFFIPHEGHEIENNDSFSEPITARRFWGHKGSTNVLKKPLTLRHHWPF